MVNRELPTELYQNEQIIALEKIAILHYGLSDAVLMAKAGEAAFRLFQEQYPGIQRLIVFCGPGKNGGDGYVLASLAHKAGMQVFIYTLGEAEPSQRLIAKVKEQCHEVNIAIAPFSSKSAASLVKTDAAQMIIDAIFGTGLKREVTGCYKEAIELINAQPCPVFSLDIPSGLDGDSGQVLGEAVRADLTCTFVGFKQGLFTGKGPDYTGDIFLADLDLPDEVFAKVKCSSYRIGAGVIEEICKPRRRSAHKGDFGHVLVIGGNYGMPGSVRMAAEAALRVGAGRVTVATRSEHIASIVASRPEIMCYGISSVEDLPGLVERATVIVLGPGLGQDAWANALFSTIIQQTGKPVIIDADGLNLLAQRKQLNRDALIKNKNWILTPHPGEAARLLATHVKEIQADRFSAISALQELYAGLVVLKGAGTLIIDTSATISIVDIGNPGMASAGMGDVLSGVIAGLAAQKIPLDLAVEAGVWSHAKAGDLAAKMGERGLLASDLMPYLRQIVNQ